MTSGKRLSNRYLIETLERLNERDLALLETVRICRYITSHQIMRLHYPRKATFSLLASIRATNRHLHRLSECGLLTCLERRIGGVRAGSGTNVWRLSEAGQRLLLLARRIDGTDSKRSIRKRYHEPTLQFLKHRLAISELYVRLRELVTTNHGRNATLDKAELEPACWREYAGSLKSLALKPDLYAVTSSSEYEDHWFFEVDLATESPVVVVRKCEQYIRYYQSGTEQHKAGVFPRVVWLVPTDKRKETIARHIGERLSEGNSSLFTVIVLDELASLILNGENIS